MAENEADSGELERAVVDAVAAHGNIPPKYGAVTALARAYARNIDEAGKVDVEFEMKALYLGPHLLNTLKLLDLAPSGATATTSDAPGRGTPTDPAFTKARATVMDLMSERRKKHGA